MRLWPQFEGRIVAGVTATDVLQDFEDSKCLGVVIFQDGTAPCIINLSRICFSLLPSAPNS